MKIIHLSDPHIYTDKIHGIDPVDRLKKALDHIIINHSDADLFAITGDITDLGDKESYQLFIEILVIYFIYVWKKIATCIYID